MNYRLSLLLAMGCSLACSSKDKRLGSGLLFARDNQANQEHGPPNGDTEEPADQPSRVEGAYLSCRPDNDANNDGGDSASFECRLQGQDHQKINSGSLDFSWVVVDPEGVPIIGAVQTPLPIDSPWDVLIIVPAAAKAIAVIQLVVTNHGAKFGSFAAGLAAVHPCKDLQANGSWESITPAAFASPTNMETWAVVVDPSDESVYAAAGNKTNGGNVGTGIYKSTDCGATFTLVSTGTNGDELATGNPWAMLLDPDHPGTLYINNGYGNGPTIYKSTTGGVDWTPLNPDSEQVTGAGLPFVQAIALDPFDSAHLAVTFHENCGSPYNPWCFSQSSDGGATWHLFNGPVSVPGFSTINGWQEATSISILGPSSYIVSSSGGVYYTGDGGASWTLVVAADDYTSPAGSTHILPDGTLYIGVSNGPIFQSAKAEGQNPPFAISQASSLPSPTLQVLGQAGLSPAVTVLAGSPHATKIIDDGVSLFASDTLPVPADGAPFYTASLTSPASWTKMPDKICANGVCRGSNEMAYDSVHHVVYSANLGAGLWRLVTH